jgi:hypothetical protein
LSLKTILDLSFLLTVWYVSALLNYSVCFPKCIYILHGFVVNKLMKVYVLSDRVKKGVRTYRSSHPPDKKKNI